MDQRKNFTHDSGAHTVHQRPVSLYAFGLEYIMGCARANGAFRGREGRQRLRSETMKRQPSSSSQTVLIPLNRARPLGCTCALRPVPGCIYPRQRERCVRSAAHEKREIALACELARILTASLLCLAIYEFACFCVSVLEPRPHGKPNPSSCPSFSFAFQCSLREMASPTEPRRRREKHEKRRKGSRVEFQQTRQLSS